MLNFWISSKKKKKKSVFQIWPPSYGKKNWFLLWERERVAKKETKEKIEITCIAEKVGFLTSEIIKLHIVKKKWYTFLSTIEAFAGCLWNGLFRFSFLIEIVGLVPLFSIILGMFSPKGFFKGFLPFVLVLPFGRLDWG